MSRADIREAVAGAFVLLLWFAVLYLWLSILST